MSSGNSVLGPATRQAGCWDEWLCSKNVMGRWSTSAFCGFSPQASNLQLENFNVLLLGKTGQGKSATGNTLLQQNVFESHLSFDSHTSKCVRKSAKVVDAILNVVDTPGTMDTRYPDRTLKEIVKAIDLCSEGFDAVFIVMKVDEKMTEEHQESINQLKRIFVDLMKYALIIFTHAEQFRSSINESFGTFLKNVENPFLKGLCEECNWRFCLIENRGAPTNEAMSMVNEIKDLVTSNKHKRYTNQYFETAKALLEKKVPEAERQKQIYIQIRNDHNECFPATATVLIDTYRRILMTDLKVGDRVLAGDRFGKMFFSEVYMFGHSLRYRKSMFVCLKTKNHLLKVSAGHHVYVLRQDMMSTLPACKVGTGDSLLTVSPEEDQLVWEEVQTTSSMEEHGLFAPFTMSGSIVVNYVLASCYVDLVPPRVAHPLLWPLRQTYKMSPSAVATINTTGKDGVPRWVRWCLKIICLGKNIVT